MKLLELRKWLRISEAAQYLSLNFREEVKDTDILQFVLNKQLLLSVYLFERVVVLPVQSSSGDLLLTQKQESIEIELLPETKLVSGLVDLLPLHGGLDAIESIYRQHLGGAPTPLRSFAGLLVRTEDYSIYQIQESLTQKQSRELEQEGGDAITDIVDYGGERLEAHRSGVMLRRGILAEARTEYQPRVNLDPITPSELRSIREEFRPAVELPKGCLACISIHNLKKFVTENCSEEKKEPNERPGELERSSLLKLVLGMAVAKYDYRPGAARNPATGANRGSINSDLERLGLTLDPETIRKFITEANSKFDVYLPGKKNDLS